MDLDIMTTLWSGRHYESLNPLAGQEALAHMEILIRVGGLDRSHFKEGVHYFKNSGESFEEVYQRVLELVKDKKISSLLRY